MADTWIESTANPENVDLETIAANKNTIKVNDVDSDDRDRPGIWAINDNDDADARALRVDGMAEVTAVSTGNPASTGLKVTNASTSTSARAVEVEGPDADNTVAMEVTNDNTHANTRALKVKGRTEITAISTGNPSTTGLQVTNVSSHNNANAIKVEGRTEMVHNALGDPTLEVTNAYGTGDPIALKVGGKSVLDGEVVISGDISEYSGTTINIDDEVHIKDDLTVDGDLKVGPSNDTGTIDSGGSSGSKEDLEIGLGDGTDEVKVKGLALDLFGSSGNINSLGTVQSPLGVYIGDQARTSVISLGHSTADVYTDGTLHVQGGKILVGNNADGEIDASDDDEDLKIGTDSDKTQNVIISRANKYARIDGNLCVNSTETVIDGQTSLVAGSGFKYNPAGQVPPNPSIDFYIGGVLVGFLDTNGWQ